MDESSVSVATPTVTLKEILRQKATRSPEKPAYIFLSKEKHEPQTLTYRELDQRVCVVAARLQQLVAPGERALLLYPSSLEYIVAFFACLYAGVIAVPAYPPHAVRPHHTMPRLKAIVQNARASVALTTSALLAKNTLIFDEWLGGSGLLSHWLATDTIDEISVRGIYEVPLTSDTLALLQYTSGSTATPKGVMLTSGNLIANAKLQQKVCQVPETSTYCSWLPFYHDLGLIAHIIQSLYIGSTCVLMSPMSFLQRPALWLETISRYQVYMSAAPNFAFDLCVQRISKEQRARLDLSSWKVALLGGEPVRAQTLQRFVEAFSSCGVSWETLAPAYGLAEATVGCTGKEAGTRPIIRSVVSKALREGSVVVAEEGQAGTQTVVGCGKTTMSEKMLIVHPETCTLCAPDQVGEIWVAGPHIAKGYWDRPEETEATFGAFLKDTGDGPFLRTGDLGFVLDGNVFVAGRLKDLIIIDGTNYYPQDIEHTVEQCHSALRSGCCIAFSVDIQGQERLVVVVEVDARVVPADTESPQSTTTPEHKTVSADAIVKKIQRAVHEQFEIPTTVLLIKAGTIPKTTSGKIQRRACREDFLNARLNLWRK